MDRVGAETHLRLAIEQSVSTARERAGGAPWGDIAPVLAAGFVFESLGLLDRETIAALVDNAVFAGALRRGSHHGPDPIIGGVAWPSDTVDVAPPTAPLLYLLDRSLEIDGGTARFEFALATAGDFEVHVSANVTPTDTRNIFSGLRHSPFDDLRAVSADGHRATFVFGGGGGGSRDGTLDFRGTLSTPCPGGEVPTAIETPDVRPSTLRSPPTQ